MDSGDELSVVPGQGLFAKVPAAEWAQVRRVGVPVRFEPRDLMLRQGDNTQHVHVILAGCVKVSRAEPDGGRTTLTLRAAGDVVGDMAAVDQQPRSATVTALIVTFTQLLTGSQFRSLLARPAMAAAFTTYTVSRLRSSDAHRTELAVLPVRQRLARALLQLEEQNRRVPGRPPLRLSQAELADLVGASRNAVVAELAALREAAIVVTSRREVAILNPAALRLVTGSPTG